MQLAPPFGADIFKGPQTGSLCQYDRKDRVFRKLV